MHREISVKDFSGSTLPEILIFGTNIEYDLLDCARENQHPHAYHLFYLSIFVSLQQHFIFVADFLAYIRGRLFKLHVLLRIVVENFDAEIYFAIFFLSISHSNVMQM